MTELTTKVIIVDFENQQLANEKVINNLNKNK